VSLRNDSARRTRIITVQGPLQLLNVIAVLRYQQEKEGMDGYDDLLLIGALSHVQGPQAAGMYAACMEIRKAWNFSRVIDLASIEQNYEGGIPVVSSRARALRRVMQATGRMIEWLRRVPRTRRVRLWLGSLQQWLGSASGKWLFADSIEQLRNAVDARSVEHVYACRNTQFVNELTLSAFPDARRICYGDGLGYIALNKSFGSPKYNHRGFLPMHRACLITPVETEPGHLDLVDLTVVPHRFYVETLRAVADNYDELRQKAEYFSTLSEGLPITIVLTSYLAEVGVVASLEDELDLYENCVLPHLSDREFILIKGHPREAHGQSEMLARRIRQAGFRCAAMTDAMQWPVELFAPLLPVRKIVNYLSTGFVGMLMVRQCPVVLGLGAKAYRERVRFDDQLEAIRSEQLMILLARQAFAGEFTPIRLSDEQFLRTELPEHPLLVCPVFSEEIAGSPL
jgi:hypothetical protein